MRLPERVTLCEVGTRDGFQIEPEFIPTEQKIEVVDLLTDAGLPRIEVTSFVSPKAVPQLRDAESVRGVAAAIGGELGWSRRRVKRAAEEWPAAAVEAGVDPARPPAR